MFLKVNLIDKVFIGIGDFRSYTLLFLSMLLEDVLSFILYFSFFTLNDAFSPPLRKGSSWAASIELYFIILFPD